MCIVFDEVTSQQVLANKMVFQAGVDPLTLSQSPCNQHAYQVWLYKVPMILCSNFFQKESMNGSPMSDEDVDYLKKNIIDASLPEGELWYYKNDDEVMEEAQSDGEGERGEFPPHIEHVI